MLIEKYYTQYYVYTKYREGFGDKLKQLFAICCRMVNKIK